MNEWVIFDMDNTLINTEPLYLDAIDKFVQLMTVYGFISEAKIRSRQGEIDGALLKEMGYSTDRFAESFERTFREFVKNSPIPWDDQMFQAAIRTVRHIAMDVFNQKSPEYEYAMAAVRKIAAAGYNIAVITAGERWVQIKRFDDLTMRNLFQDCWVVLRKDKQVFQDFIVKHDVDVSRSWMIGDSMKSDILPAIDAGLRAIHLQTSNWSARDGNLELPIGAVSVKDLSEAPSVILGVSHA